MLGTLGGARAARGDDDVGAAEVRPREAAAAMRSEAFILDYFGCE